MLAPVLLARAQTGGEQASQTELSYQAELPAQESPAHISVVDGAATVERDGQSQPASPNAPFVPGDRLRTSAGRVEMLLPDGSALDVDQYSVVDLQSPTLIRLVSGRLLLVVARAANPGSAVRYQIDTPVASAQIDSAGEYRVAVLNGANGLEAELAVLRGLASLITERGSMPVRAGERSVARDAEAPSFPQAFNSARFDAFDRWAAARRDERTGAVSSEYLPQDLQMYGGALDRYGSWQYTSPYGYAWYPTVADDWRPYYYGYWSPYQSWGWTWIGVDAWAWPTHHFGRWGFGRNRWFWVPGRTWSPAWVAWAGAPGFVSWCPLGFDGRPVFAFSLGFASRWGGWTVLPRNSFGLAARVDRFAVAPHWIPPSTHFVAERTAPVALPRTAHAQNVVTGGGGVGTALPVPRRNVGAGLNPGTAQPPRNGAVQTRIGTGDARAVPRTPVTAGPRTVTAPAPPTVHEFKQPLPGAGEPAPYGQRRGYSVVAPRGETPAPPASRSRGETPAPQAVPRWNSPGNVAPPSRTYQPYQAPSPRVDHPNTPPPRVDRSYAPPSPRVDHSYATPPPRVDRSYAPPAQMMAVPRSAPPPSAAPHSGGSQAPPPSHSGGSGGSSNTSHGGSSGRSSSGEAHRR